jgi:hypothetical protein
MYVYMYAWIHICVYVCLCICVYTCISLHINNLHLISVCINRYRSTFTISA